MMRFLKSKYPNANICLPKTDFFTSCIQPFASKPNGAAAFTVTIHTLPHLKMH